MDDLERMGKEGMVEAARELGKGVRSTLKFKERVHLVLNDSGSSRTAQAYNLAMSM